MSESFQCEVFIALGSNLGDRRASLDAAIAALKANPRVRVVRLSTVHETEPVGGPQGQGKYLNAAAELATSYEAGELLVALHAIEASLGRVRRLRDEARGIDLDLLLFGERRIQQPGLTVPHPRMFERDFVMTPLREIADARLLKRMQALTGAETAER